MPNLKPLLALLMALALAVPLPGSRPASATYCAPLAFRDQVLPPGYQAIIRAAPGCKKPSLVRKQSFTGSVIEQPFLVRVGTVERTWLFTHRLYYTLDGKNWKRLEVR